MNARSRIWIYPLITMGSILVLATSCKKDNDNNNPSITITDVDGNIYSTIIIGTQVYMAENLKTTKYQNGDLIGTTIPDTLDLTPEASPKYQWAPDRNETNVSTYGRLYTWYAVTDSRNICPTGWHVPTYAEWNTLTTYLGGLIVAGGKLKETDTTHFQSPNAGATNETRFTALPAGYRSYDGIFLDITSLGHWWSSTENDTVNSWYLGLGYSNGNVYRYSVNKRYGFSIRCLQD